MPDPFYSSGLRFSCVRCSACCRFDPGFVYVSAEDLKRLCRWAHLTAAQFIRTYCRWVPSSDGAEVLCLREKKGYDCILWDNGCTAYESRPVQCSTYPFWDYLLSDKKNWDNAGKSCPGVNSGEMHDILEIRRKLRQRSENPPLRRADADGVTV